MSSMHTPPPYTANSNQIIKNWEDKIRDINDLRTLSYFAYRLNSLLSSPAFSDITRNEKSVIKPALIEHLRTAYIDDTSRSTQVDWLIFEAGNNLISLKQFDWLKDNEDACCAIWGFLSNVPNRLLYSQSTNNQLIDSSPDAVFYHQLSLPQKPTSHTERFEVIKAYFDNWIDYSLSPITKLNLMMTLKNHWLSMLKAVKTFAWLEKPEREQCEWAWTYLQSYHRKETAESGSGIVLIDSFYPINDHEKFLAIYAVLRLWNCHKAEKTLLLKNMNRAWRERQRRREREDKKAINSYVDVKIKQRLDLLARYNRCQINEVLSDLINKEYKRLEDEIDKQFNI